MVTREAQFCEKCDFSLSVEEVEAEMTVCADCDELPPREALPENREE